tara:strand:- start:1929 stop:2117 length:189 start_codon:yes stop_codon:yes gene_type:complete
VETGDYVREGIRLGMIADDHGYEPEMITTPASGILPTLSGAPPVTEGDNIMVIGRIPADTSL